MTEKQWETFFQLLDRIVELELPYKEKKALVLNKAADQGERYESALEEFASWF